MLEKSELELGVAKARRLGIWATGLLAACVLLEIAMLNFTASAEVQGCVALLFLLALIASATLWLCWLHRAYSNLKLLGTRETRFTTGWAVGYWFVPVLNLFRPYQIVADLWMRSREANAVHADLGKPSSIVPLWWVCWLGSGFLERFSFGPAIAPIGRPVFLALLSVLILGSGLAAMTIIRRIGAFQQEAARHDPALLEVFGEARPGEAGPAPFSWYKR